MAVSRLTLDMGLTSGRRRPRSGGLDCPGFYQRWRSRSRDDSFRAFRAHRRPLVAKDSNNSSPKSTRSSSSLASQSISRAARANLSIFTYADQIVDRGHLYNRRRRGGHFRPFEHVGTTLYGSLSPNGHWRLYPMTVSTASDCKHSEHRQNKT